MAILLVILLIGAGMLIAMLNGSDGRTSAFGDSLTIAIVVVVVGLSAILIKLMVDDYQAERLRDGKPRLKFSRKRAKPYLRLGLPLLLMGFIGIAAYKIWQTWPIPEPIAALAETPTPATTTVAAPEPTTQAVPAAASDVKAAPQPAVDTSRTQREIQDTLAAWQTAWSSRQIAAYLEHYSPSFMPSDGLSRPAWERQRRERLGKARDVVIDITDLSFADLDADSAEVSFRQAYKARGFAETSRKTLTLAHENGVWRIVRETSRPL
jgi:ketosteroid isomerase-like protein